MLAGQFPHSNYATQGSFIRILVENNKNDDVYDTDMAEKFNCRGCGECCANIGGFLSDDERSFMEEYGHGKLPLVQVTPTDQMTFPLWDFEAERFLLYGDEKGIDPKIGPSRGFYDLDTNRFVVVTYHINSKRCPFLGTNGGCRIYEKERALICYLYPFNKSPFYPDSKASFGSCPNAKDFGGRHNINYLKELHGYYGDILLASIEHDYIMEWSNRMIVKMMKEKKIRPALNYPYKNLLRRIENSDKIDFTSFLIESGEYGSKEMEKAILCFKEFADAKRILDIV